MHKLLIIFILILTACSKKETSKEEVFAFLDKNPQLLQEFLKNKAKKESQKRILGLSIDEVNNALGKNLPFNFSEKDMLFFGNKTIIGLETSLDCPVICRNNFKEIKKFALKNDIGVGLILTKSKNSQLDKYTLSAIDLYPDKKALIIEEVINNPNMSLDKISKKLKLDHEKILKNKNENYLNLKTSSQTPLIYINTLIIKGVYRQEAFEEVFKLLF